MEFKVFKRDFSQAPTQNGTCLVIGNFDGVHKGHKTLIAKAVLVAKEQGLTPALYTFEPHPKKLFMGEKAPRPITPLALKAEILRDLGIKLLFARPFTKSFASTHFEDFVQHLVNDLNLKHIIVGEDFSFGKGREGNVEKLQNLAEKYNFTVEVFEDIPCKEDVRYSSSRIRELLSEGEIEKATSLLGHPFQIKTHFTEDDYCNLIAPFLRYTPVKNGVYFAKVKYTNPPVGAENGVVPVKVLNNTAYIAPMEHMPEFPEGRIILTLTHKIEE